MKYLKFLYAQPHGILGNSQDNATMMESVAVLPKVCRGRIRWSCGIISPK
ncbi:MAG: hypothetical protein HQ518_12975 [Rhodopirellula sp.]|nr:hypothetical protein [Rhodopirellula sp.]